MITTFKIYGRDDFYSGWLARLLEQPRTLSRSKGWQKGWNAANKSPMEQIGALRPLIQMGNIIVDYDE